MRASARQSRVGNLLLGRVEGRERAVGVGEVNSRAYTVDDALN